METSTKKESFLKDVAHEVKMLKQHATPSELQRLDLKYFFPDDREKCIYGQITGHCESPRAKELMDKCCIRIMNLFSGVSNIHNRNIEDGNFRIGEEYKGQTWGNMSYSSVIPRKYSYLSALEGYIVTKDAKVEHIINYLKGEEAELSL